MWIPNLAKGAWGEHPVGDSGHLIVAKRYRQALTRWTCADLDIGDSVDVAVHKGALVVTPVRRVRGGSDLRALVRRIPKGDTAVEFDWGAPAGREVW